MGEGKDEKGEYLKLRGRVTIPGAPSQPLEEVRLYEYNDIEILADGVEEYNSKNPRDPLEQ